MPGCPVRPHRRAPAAALGATAAIVLVGLILSGCGSVSGAGPGGPSGPVPASAAPTRTLASVPVPSAALRSALGCPRGTPVAVDHRLDVPTTAPATVVVAHCESAAGSPPSGVYVVTRSGSGAGTRIAATLVPASAEIEVSTLTRDAGTVRMAGVGYSASTVARCCPDLTVGRTWQVRGDHLVPTG